MSLSLVQKYNVPGPRYTSYPTVPYWEEDSFTTELWKKTLIQSFEESNESEGISLYIHLPFCESLCTFCGCNKRITKNHEVEKPYIQAVLKEWQLYLNHFSEKPRISEIHLGGGTPTFLSASELTRLIEGIDKLTPRCEVNLRIERDDGTAQNIKTRCRIDTNLEMTYFRAGGIPVFVTRKLVEAARAH